MRYILIFLRYTFFFLVFSTPLLGQSNRRYSPVISKEINQFITTTDTLKKVTRFIKKALKTDTLLGIEYHKLFFQRGTEQQNDRIKYYSGEKLGEYYYSKSDYPTALPYIVTAIEAAEKIKDTARIIRVVTRKGNIFFQLGNKEKALANYLIAQAYIEQSGLKEFELYNLSNIGNIRVQLKSFDDALETYNSILTILKKEKYHGKSKYIKTYLSTLLGKAKCQKEVRKLDEAIFTCLEGIQIAEKYTSLHHKGDFYISMGSSLYLKNEYDTAIEHLTKGKEVLTAIEGEKSPSILLANYFLAQCYNKTSKKEKAIALLEKNFIIIGDDCTTNKLKDMYLLRAELAKSLKDFKTESTYRLVRNDLINEENENQNKAREILFKNDKKVLEHKNNQLIEDNKTSTITNKIAISAAVLLLSLLLFSFIYYKKRNKTREIQFQKIIQELQAPQEIKTEVSPNASIIKDTQAKKILDKLSDLEKTFFFISNDCNLYTTAKSIETNTTYLSKAINTYKKQSFNQYLNELRINYVLTRLKEDSKFRSYTIKAISEDIGYKSANTFIKVFKERTNLNPSYYIKQLEINN